MAKATVKKAAKKAAPKKAITTTKKSAATAPKKAVKTKLKAGKPLLKYEDKSKGQPKELQDIFESIKKMLLPYAKGNMQVHGGDGGQITVISHKPVTIMGKERPEMWFAAALIQKGYVGFYFTPAYADESVRKQIHPELLSCLKGKSCFHIKKDDTVIYKQIKEALKLGFDTYTKKGWI